MSVVEIYDVGVAQYERGSPSNPQPYHWAIMLRKSVRDAWFYQIEGNSDCYGLSPFLLKHCFKKSGAYRGAIRIGAIEANDRSRFEEILRKVPIYRNRPDWNCQNWVVAAIERLQAAGFLQRDIVFSQQALLNDLKDVEESWQTGQNVFGDEE